MGLSMITDAANHAGRAIRADPGRAAGVVLGVAVATGALTLLSAVAASGQHAIVSATGGGESAGLLEVSAARASSVARARANPRPLDRSDARSLAASRSMGKHQVATRRTAVALAVWQGKAEAVRILGVSTNTPSLLGFRATRGRLLGPGDDTGAARVALVGSRLAKRLFGEKLAPGARIELNRSPFAIVGMMAAAPSFSSGDPWDWDNSILVPEPAFEANFGSQGRRAVDRIFVAVQGGVDGALEQARNIVRAVLRYRHGGVDEFQLDSGEDRKKRLELVLQVVGALLLTTAAISLLVSSLNVMNATLISTSERSYEIGLRRSLGASRLDVFWQFVVEAGVLSLVGAAIGILAGMLLVLLTTLLVGMAVPDWKLKMLAWGPVVAVLLPVLVSGLFSAYPAWRGAGLDPVTALRRR